MAENQTGSPDLYQGRPPHITSHDFGKSCFGFSVNQAPNADFSSPTRSVRSQEKRPSSSA